MDDYRRYITALGKLYRKAKYRVARTEIPSIRQFAHQSMRDAIIADTRAVGAAALPWDALQIKVINSFTVDNFTLPNPLDERLKHWLSSRWRTMRPIGRHSRSKTVRRFLTG